MKVSGYGIGFRPQHFSALMERKNPNQPMWVEVLSENFMGTGGRPQKNLLRLREELPVCLHGVSMSIAGQDPFSDIYLRDLKDLVQQVQPVHVSDHLCWTSLKGHNTHDLLPVPYTESMLDHVCSRIQFVQEYLGRPLLFENPSAYVAFGVDSIPETEFLSEMCRRTGCGLILDVNNLYVNHKNLGVDVIAWLMRMNPAWIGYMHVAGHTVTDSIRVDTHDDHVTQDVWDLYAYINASLGALPAMIEWDDRIPEFTELLKEATLLETHAKRLVTVEQLVQIMPPPEVGLAETNPSNWRNVQRDFFSAVVSNRKAEHGLFREETPAPPKVGLDVYAHAYTARLLSVFRDAFPVLHHVLGRTHFNDLMERYLAWHQPRHYSVKYASERLKSFPGIENTAFRTGIDLVLLRDLISFEWILYDLRDARGEEGQLTRESLAIIKPEEWSSVVFTLQPAVALLAVTYRVDLVLQEFHASGNPEMPVRQNATFLIYRGDGEVSWLLLSDMQCALVQAIQEGLPFEVCCTLAHEQRGDGQGLEVTIEEAVSSIGIWMDHGVVAEIHSQHRS